MAVLLAWVFCRPAAAFTPILPVAFCKTSFESPAPFADSHWLASESYHQPRLLAWLSAMDATAVVALGMAPTAFDSAKLLPCSFSSPAATFTPILPEAFCRTWLRRWAILELSPFTEKRALFPKKYGPSVP
jgi:hypothetical protein